MPPKSPKARKTTKKKTSPSARGKRAASKKEPSKKRTPKRKRSPSRIEEERVNVLILGAGPAGLATAAALLDRGIASTLLEKGDSEGHSWRTMPTYMRLNSPWDYSRLREDDLPFWTEQEYVSRQRFAEYLENFCQSRALDVRTGCDVRSVDKSTNGFTVTLSDGRRFKTNTVVNATGYYANPRIPDYPGKASLVRVHTVEYGDPQNLLKRTKGGRRVLIVGARVTAEQTMIELFDAGWDVTLSSRTEMRFSRLMWMEGIKNFIYLRVEDALVKRMPFLKRNSYPNMSDGRPKNMITSGQVSVRPEIQKYDGKRVHFVDGTSGEFDAVVFCTGYDAALAHLRALSRAAMPGEPVTEKSIPLRNGVESADHTGLYVMGLDNQVNFRSRYLRGIREDAERVAQSIAAHRG